MPGTYQYDVEIKSNVAKLLSDMKQVQDRLDTVEGKEYKIKLNVDEKKLSNVISNLEKMLDSLGKGTGDFKQFENLSKELSSIVSEVQSLSKAFGKVDDSGAKTLLYSIQNIDKSLSELSQNILNVNKNMSNMGGNTSGAVKQVENISNAYQNAAKEAEKLADAQSKIGQKTNISSGSNPVIEQQNKLQEELKETQQQAKKTHQSISKLVEGRDIVSQNWYREKGTVVGKDSKGNDITRDADEFSFVERLKNGQLQTVLATYDEKTEKWAEQVINVRTAFEQVEKAIISADNKIASLEMTKEKTLAAHPGYDTTADDNQIAIERKKRDELQNTLNLYGQEKEYVFEIEAANKRIADNQERLNNKKQSQTNLQATKESETIEKQLQKEIETSDKANQKKFQDFQKEQANYEESVNKVNSAIQKTDEILDTLPLHDKLDGQFLDMIDSVDNLNSKLKSGEFTLSEYKNEVKSVTSEYSKMVSIQQKRDVEDYKANAKANLENAKNIKAEWDKNLKAIQDYMDAVTKLNNLKAKDKGTGSEANQIALQTQNVEELKQAAWDARKNLSSMQAENPDIIAWKQWVDMMELFDQASKGSAESAAKLKDVLNNIKAPSLDKYESRLSSYLNKTGGYDATIARFNDGGWTSSAYLENVQAVKDAVKEYETLLDNIKTNQNGIASDEDIQNLDKYEKKIKDTIATVTNMSASEKGYSQLAGQKEIDKINKILRENSAMSSEAKAKIKAYKQELISGNPSVSLEKIHGEIMKIVNAEELAGRAGRSMFDVIKEKAFYGFAAQIGMYFGFNDIVNGFKQVASTVIDLNTQITDLAKVSEATSSQIYDDFSSYADIAKDIGGTISDTISATADWSRNGYNLPDSKELARVALLYKNVGDGIDIDTANESLISTLRGFKMEADEAEKIIDIFNNVSNNEPIDSGGIGEALQRSAASFNAANTSLQESVALISTTNSVIQNPEKVGNMWKVVSMRIRSATSELEQAGEDTDGLVTSTADLQKMIKAMTGYDILESDGKTFKSIYDIVLNISKVWNNLSDLDQSSLLQALAGVTTKMFARIYRNINHRIYLIARVA